ncbi:sulfur carrier protein ThiS [Granulosicoccus sp. 3-233]|uniref:sulfur carrier protein ThiS n=1 Tax=Granulosicoccus sp. 3-233 TaxID=3417969 RepID=UPI003D33DAF4
MKIRINGEQQQVESCTLHDLLEHLGHGANSVATAVNQEFVPIGKRSKFELSDDDAVDIIAPMSGG